MGAAQHKEDKDAPGYSGWLGHFLGSLAGVHLAPADPEVVAVVPQPLRADRAARNRAGSLYLRCGFCSAVGSVLSLLFALSLLASRLQGRGTFFAGARLQHSALCVALLLCCPHRLQPSLLGLTAPLHPCCSDVLLLSLYCKALASSPGQKLFVPMHSGHPSHGLDCDGLCKWLHRALASSWDLALNACPGLQGLSFAFLSVIPSPPVMGWEEWGCPDGYPTASALLILFAQVCTCSSSSTALSKPQRLRLGHYSTLYHSW